MECVIIHEQEWYRVRYDLSSLDIKQEMEDFFIS